ncbi:SHOCT domain-containing protein (plasmid) [Haloferacaceae archaeon DSL9]
MAASDDILQLLAIVILVFVFAMLFLIPTAMRMLFGVGTIAWTVGIGGLWLVWMLWLPPILLLFALGILCYQYLTRGEDPAFRELRYAYARGDLSHEEYEQRRERLIDER